MTAPKFSSSLQFSTEASANAGTTVGAAMEPALTSIGVCLELLLALLLLVFSPGGAASASAPAGGLEGRRPGMRSGR